MELEHERFDQSQVSFRTFCILLGTGIASVIVAAFIVQLYREHHEPSLEVSLSTEALSTGALTTRGSIAPAPAVAPGPLPSSGATSPVPTRILASAEQPASISTQGSANAAAPMPIAFHIRNLRDQQRIEGEVRNVSSHELSITMQAVSASSGATTELQLTLAPGENKTYSTEDGLVMAAHDKLILSSPPFQNRVVQVP
jgi:hypothetical protein